MSDDGARPERVAASDPTSSGPRVPALLHDHGATDDPAAFHEGAPRWLSEMVRHCSRCGAALRYGPLDGEHRERHACAACGFIAYINPRLVVTTLPITERGELILLRRAIEPGYGRWAQPGGFLEADETAIQGAIRETREETGLEVVPTGIVGLYSRPQGAIVVVAFAARIVGGVMSVTPEALDVRPYRLDAIPWDEIAFDTSIWAIGDLVRSVDPALAPPIDRRGAVRG